ncbi:hypothetical protein Agub_g4364, partial [Astrephomene gubernaculifera]
LSGECVLVTEWVEGEKLSDSASPDVRALCSTLLSAYLVQLLGTGLLHADPHPGNLMRTRDGKICVLDFGLMTEVTPEQRLGLLEFIAHLTTQDWPRLACDLQTLGFIPPHVDPRQAELVEPLGRVMGQLSGGGGATRVNIDKVMGDLQTLGKHYPIQVPPFFALILRAFSVIEGIALRVDPAYSIVADCLPYLATRLLEDDSPRVRALLRDILYGSSSSSGSSSSGSASSSYNGGSSAASSSGSSTGSSEAAAAGGGGSGGSGGVVRRQRMDVARLIRLAEGLAAFSTDGLSRSGSGSSNSSEGLTAGGALVATTPVVVASAGLPAGGEARGLARALPAAGGDGDEVAEVASGRRAAATSSSSFPPPVASSSSAPVLSPAVVAALRAVVRPGSYLSELLAEEVVAAVDALSR